MSRASELHTKDVSTAMNYPESEWAEDLKAKLSEAADLYRECLASHRDRPGAYELRDRIDPDAEPIDVARIYMLKSLGAVMGALTKLPEFSDSAGREFMPLHDLAQALRGLNEGRRSELLDTRKAGQRSRHPVEAQRQALAVALVEFFERAGLKNAEARNEVARILGDAGFTGRKGGAISSQTLFEWKEQIRGEDDGSPRQEVLAQYRAVLFPTEMWAPTVAEARALALSMAQSLLFQSQI